jgi:hypothetical protein
MYRLSSIPNRQSLVDHPGGPQYQGTLITVIPSFPAYIAGPSGLLPAGYEGCGDIRSDTLGISFNRLAVPGIGPSRLDRERSAGLLHRLDSIKREVHQNLLQLHPVRRDFGKIGGKVCTNRNGVLVAFAPQKQDHFVDDFIHVDRLSLCERPVLAACTEWC